VRQVEVDFKLHVQFWDVNSKILKPSDYALCDHVMHIFKMKSFWELVERTEITYPALNLSFSAWVTIVITSYTKYSTW
jgi:hypothetical protein